MFAVPSFADTFRGNFRYCFGQAKIFHYGSISLIDEPSKSAHLAALKHARKCGCILSYDPNLRLPLWPSPEAARDGIMSIWDQSDIVKVQYNVKIMMHFGAWIALRV